jgi:Thiol:disulfide interchange protein DsbD, N-terminal
MAFAQKPAGVVSVRLVLASDAVHAGEPVKLAAVARIAPGFHINDHHPSEEYLIPTELKLNPSDKLSVEKLVYPKGELKRFPFSDTPLSVYQGTLSVGALIKIAPSTPAGDFPLAGKFSYQACNDHECLAPASVAVSLTVKVVKRGAPLKPTHQEIFSHLKFK